MGSTERVNYGAFYRGYVRIVSGLKKSTEHVSKAGLGLVKAWFQVANAILRPVRGL